MLFVLVFGAVGPIASQAVFAEDGDNQATEESDSGGFWQGVGAIGKGVVIELIKWPVSAFNSVLGILMSIVTWGITNFSQYNGFIHEKAVKDGWNIIVSFCNMFFILILLIIAFANILNIDSYKIKSTLPKVIIMAILINFSLLICGLLIDFSQIFMMTFVNAIGTSGGNYINTLGVDRLFREVSQDQWSGEINAFSAIIGMIMTSVFLLIALVTLIYILIIIVMRIAMLWIYTVLSPFAFLLSAFPAGKAYAQKWWDRFSKELIVGPVLMFFVWFAFYMVNNVGVNVKENNSCMGPVDMFCTDGFLNFFMAIAMLIGGLKVAQEIGGVTGGVAAKAIGRIQQGKDTITGGLKKGGKNLVGAGVDKLSQKAKVDLNPFRVYRRVTQQMDRQRSSRETKAYQAALEGMDEGPIRSKLAHLSTGDLAWRNFTSLHKKRFGLDSLNKRVWKGGKGINEDAEKLSDEKEDLEKQRKQVLSPEEYKREEEKYHQLEKEKENIDKQIEEESSKIKNLEPGEQRDKTMKNLESLKQRKQGVNEDLKNQKERFEGKEEKWKGQAENLDNQIAEKQKEIKEFNKKYQVPGKAAARAQSLAELEGEEGKVIAHIDSSEVLSQMFDEAVENQRPGLAAAIVKKMTKNGDYNELQSHINAGTGLQGMKDLGQKLQDSGLSKQSALEVLSCAGSTAKGIGHFGAFGAVTMKNGRLEYASDKEYESAKLAEMLKMQTQQFARNVNRLGLGYYKNGDHSMKNWELSPAAKAYLKLNNESVGDNYNKTGQQNALEHLATKLDELKKAGVEENSDLIQAIKSRTWRSKGEGADVEAMIEKIQKSEQ